MRTTIIALVLLVWGAAILFDGLFNGVDGAGSYATGQWVAVAFGGVVVLAAARHLILGKR
jgi:hypothetical protein